jgi:membrane fusion protein, multidrug efflux system
MRHIPPRVAFVVALALVFCGCGKKEPPGGAPGGPAARAEAGVPGKSARMEGPPITVAVEPAALDTIASYYAATATLEPSQEADVLARVSGVILEIAAEEGDHVREGETLLRIQDTELRFRLQQAEAEASKQKTKFERLTKMYEGNLVSADEFETAKNDLASAEAARDLAKLQLSYTRVAAPFTGSVVRRLVDPGQTVSDGTALFSMADLDRLLARVHVPAKEFRSIKTDQPVELSLDSGGETLRGRITLVSPVIDATTGTIKVTVEVLHHPASVRPGDFAQVRVVTDRHLGVVAVPRGAVIEDRGERVVYVAADSVADRRPVTVGFQDDDRAEIVSGVKAGELVVVQGQRSLKHGARLKILDRMTFAAEPASRPES